MHENIRRMSNEADFHLKQLRDETATKTLQAVPVPWPSEFRPHAVLPKKLPEPKDPLPKCDVLVVTWTSGEAQTLASLMTGGNFEHWYSYQSNVDAFIPKVTGSRAPFNDHSAEMKRYYHTLGLYCPFHIGKISGIALKSGLHMAYDGTDVPLVDLWKQMIAETGAKLVITTGTGGGIGASIQLGDVVIANATRFHLTGYLKGKSYASAAYPTSASTFDLDRMKALITDELLRPNGNRLKTPRVPQMIYPADGVNVVSTDTFAFDDSTDHFGLQKLGKCCDMGDATLGLALSEVSNAPAWVAIRNASDPQIPNPDNSLDKAKQVAESIYGEYQCITTAGSVIATWAAIVAQLGS
jgi:nucleoside phosphorylase